ncbi:tRNA preQ1(34) S-adenosylmethionine ribosyltransferase-isomerase QueA [Sulfurovum sp. bin170]|uniref:tRNA preQ1(34) S-adenosylmethionine ribosyltransferase-isomerase QueA n=1 Tax=Sulfurovum sp. bin170 TaxID=2695268 RepID=UPI0013DF69AD|nr:tRNA preQ1(34) S-adenosylmethionine ribosyltransferase-isomerase QueA [Sulfurovum sp. bin170]NEW60632.1 tRNA preQ1(34) S-adenosylmethionine ribosyltransferase-isomerase QueA [Sulfurovum sp. bin170]
MNKNELLTSSYDYELPAHLIAQHPVQPRDSAKLLVYNRETDTTTHTTFKNLLEYLPIECDIFLNDTKVIKARIFGKKKSGGRVELLFNKPINATDYLVMIRGRVKIETELFFDDTLMATVTKLNSDGSRVVRFKHHTKDIRFEELILILDKIGHIPLPPYMHRTDNKEDEIDYQTLFAKNAGAVAAPTASLHFTPELFEALEQRHQTHKITLHIGAGTFKPVAVENILEHPMHSEYFHIPLESAEILKSEKPILAIGTTVTRTVEYFSRTGKVDGECDLFLNPYNRPKRVTHLLTNFHLPKSTLIMLVSAFVGREKTLELYHEAISKNYRFFSYGDAMLII